MKEVKVLQEKEEGCRCCDYSDCQRVGACWVFKDCLQGPEQPLTDLQTCLSQNSLCRFDLFCTNTEEGQRMLK